MDQAIAIRILKKIASRNSGNRLKLSRDQIFFTGIAAWPNDTPPHVRFVGFTTKEKHAMRNFGIETAVDILGTLAKGIAPTPAVPDLIGTVSSVYGTIGDTATTMSRHGGLGEAYQKGLKFTTPSGEDDRRQFEHNRAFMSSQKWANNVATYFFLHCYSHEIQYTMELQSGFLDAWEKNLRNLDIKPMTIKFPVVNLGGAQTLVININGEAVPIEA